MAELRLCHGKSYRSLPEDTALLYGSLATSGMALMGGTGKESNTAVLRHAATDSVCTFLNIPLHPTPEISMKTLQRVSWLRDA